MGKNKAPKYVTPAIGNNATGWREIWKAAPPAQQPFRNRKRVTRLVIASMAPFRAWEDWKLNAKLKETDIHPEPIFIIGHWRSGTTHLHNLMSLDPQFGYLTNLHSLFPHAFMCNRFIPWVAKKMMPGTRPMDSMKIGLNTPQEEELALMNMGPSSYYHAWAFPDVAEEFYRRNIAFTDETDKGLWMERYGQLLTKVSLNHSGRQLLLKNPPNTARIPVLLEMFPKAKFIHIHRNPFEVFASTEKLLTRVIPYFQYRALPEGFLHEHILRTYKKLMSSFLKHQRRIPQGQFVETSMSALGTDPMGELERIYTTLGLDIGAKTRKEIGEYARVKQDHRKSTYDLSEDVKENIRHAWDFVPESWY